MALLVHRDCSCCCCCWLLISMFTIVSVNAEVAPHSVKLNCTTNNDSTRNSGQLTIGAAFPLYAELRCKNGLFRNSSVEDSAFITFHFIHGVENVKQGSNAGVCIMEKKALNSAKYSAQLTIYRQVRNTLLVYLSSRSILCTYSMYTIVSSNSVQLSSPKPSLNDMIQEVHMKSRRKLSLYIINIKGHPIKNVLNLGKKVQLRGEILDNIDGTNFVAENCWVYSRNSFYQFLHNGCGDGFIFPSNIGFISNYGTIKSPFFEVFRLRDSHRLWFQCIVKFCDNVCPRKLCLWRELTKNSRNEVRRKLIFKDNFTYTALNKRYSMQSEVFYVSDPSRPVSLPVVQSRMTNNSSVELWRGNIYLLLAVYSIYYSLLLVITF